MNSVGGKVKEDVKIEGWDMLVCLHWQGFPPLHTTQVNATFWKAVGFLRNYAEDPLS